MRPHPGGGGEIRTRASLAAQRFSEPPQWTKLCDPTKALQLYQILRYNTLTIGIQSNNFMPKDKEKIPAESTLQSEPQAVVVRREPERDLVSWTAPARPFKRRDRQFYVTVFAISGIISLILFLAEGLMPVLLIISLVFLYYVLSTVQPEDVQYQVTNKGIKIAGKATNWQFLNRFWFSKRFDTDLMIVDTVLIPGRIELVIVPDIKEKLKKEVSAYIPFEEVPASGLDRVTNWVATKLPGNK